MARIYRNRLDLSQFACYLQETGECVSTGDRSIYLFKLHQYNQFCPLRIYQKLELLLLLSVHRAGASSLQTEAFQALSLSLRHASASRLWPELMMSSLQDSRAPCRAHMLLQSSGCKLSLYQLPPEV